MLKTIKSNAITSAVFAALPAVVLPALAMLAWSSSAQAQYQVGGNGHLLDANPRIGSGGFNGGGTPHTDYNINNNIVTGNVSGLNYFHGRNNGEFDQNTFEGNTNNSSFDRFYAISAPANGVQQRTTGAPNVTTFYNSDAAITGNLPNNFTPTSGGTGYIPAPTVSPLLPTGYDPRLELTNVDPTKGNLLTPGELDVSGPVDPSSGTQSIYSMSPLFGVQQSNAVNAPDSFYNSKITNIRTKNPADRPQMTPGEIQRMRDELNTTVLPTAPANNNPANNTPVNGTQPPAATPGSESLNQAALPSPVVPGTISSGQPLNSAIPNQPLNSSVTSSAESMQSTILVPAGKQSKQLADLEKRYANQKLTDVQATEKFNEEKRLLASANTNVDGKQKPGNASIPGSDANNPAGNAPAINKNSTAANSNPKSVLTQPGNAAANTVENQPYIINSLATGITAKGLANLMKAAEDKMREGKFTEAVDTYGNAEEVAPNNPFVFLGRGFAELGASYYGKADLDISHAIALDPAVLAGRYDLKGFLGEDRVKFVHDDLEDIANSEKGARPLVLLSFIAHNTGDDALAAKDLTEAARRGGYAEMIKQLRSAWNLK